MSADYDHITAGHYAAFRPNLHGLILAKCLEKDRNFSNGLDIGCGTGHSSIALSRYCDEVLGIDPSSQMLLQAHPKAGVIYLDNKGSTTGFESHQFDIITFAGSLYYAKPSEIVDEVIRICKSFATIVVYDFKLSLQEVLKSLDPHYKEGGVSEYNHQEDFSGLFPSVLKEAQKGKEETTICIPPRDLAHLILSVKEQYVALKKVFGKPRIYDKIVAELGALSDADLRVPVTLYYIKYICLKG